MQTDFYYHVSFVTKINDATRLAFHRAPQGFDKQFFTLRELLGSLSSVFGASLSYSKVYRQLAQDSVSTVVLSTSELRDFPLPGRSLVLLVHRTPRLA